MSPAPRPQWQQATALITIGAGTVATGVTFVPKAAADLTSPASVPPVTLLALEHTNAAAPGRDAMLRAAVVHIARHFLRLAQTRSPAEMEAMIWQYASTDGANHGPSCAAFASLTLELGSHIAGLDSWVTGGASYPWPVHAWADGRVDPNPASPGVVSVLQDAQSHGRWHPLGDGYAPQAGDWVLFDGHVEVVTKYHGGVLHTIGGDSLPNMSVNAHEYAGPLQDQGVAGFVDNGVGMSKTASGVAHSGEGGKHRGRSAAIPGSQAPVAPTSSGDLSPSAGSASSAHPAPHGAASGKAASGRANFGGAPVARPGATAGRAATAHANGQQTELAPRAIAAPPTVPRARFAQASRALPAQGAWPGPRGVHASGAGASARPAQAPPTTAAPQRPSRQSTGEAASRAGRAVQPAEQQPRPADQRPQHSTRSPQRAERSPQHGERRRATTADVPATGLRPARPHHARRGEAAIPGLFKGAHEHHARDVSALPPYHRHDVSPSNAPEPGTAAQQAFIDEVAHGAMATQDRYGVPASVTIAQAIDESGWGQSLLATSDHNLFGIKGTGPAGSDEQPTQEVINGQLVNLSASFQIYENIGQSIDAHGRLLAHSGDYAGAMSQSKDPNAFAAALTGVYATDPNYGAKLIQLMQQYNLYRYNHAARSAAPVAHHGAQPAHPARKPAAKPPGGVHHPARSPLPQASPGPSKTSPGRDRKPHPRQRGPIGNPVPVQPAPIAEPAPGQPAPIANPVPAHARPLAPVHDAIPARAAKTGASVAAQQAGTPPSAQAADHTQTVHHDAATPPAAVLYPGRSTRPAPLAHPARPTDLARQSSPAQGDEPGPTAPQQRVQQPERGPDPALNPGRSGTSAGPGQPTARLRPGSGTGSGSASGLGTGAGQFPGAGSSKRTGPGSGTHQGPGTGQSRPSGQRPASARDGANISGDAAIPGVPHAAAPQAGRGHARGPIGRLRPAHPNARPTLPTSRTRAAGSTAPGTAAGATAGPQGAPAPNVQPPHAGAGPTQTAHTPVPTASAPVVSHAGNAVIPGLQHHGAGPHADAGPSGGAAIARKNAATATAQAGGSSIPGAQQAVAGAVSQAPSRPAAAPGHVPAPAVPSGSSYSPGAQQAATGAVSQALADAAATPSYAPTVTTPLGGSSIPGAQHSAGGAEAPSASPAAAPSHAPTVTIRAGASDIAGAQQAAGSVSPPSAGRAAAPSHAPTATLRAGSSDIPGAQQGAAGAGAQPSARPIAAPRHAPSAPSRPASTATGRAARHPAEPAPAQTAPSDPAAAPATRPTGSRQASLRPGRAAPTPSRPATAPTGQQTAPGHSANESGRATAPGHAAGLSAHPAAAPARQRGAPRQTAAAGGSPAAQGRNTRPSTPPLPVHATTRAAVTGTGYANPAAGSARPRTTAVSWPSPGGADVSGLSHGAAATASAGPAVSFNPGSTAATGSAGSTSRAPRGSAASSAPGAAGGATLTVYHAHMPPSVREAFVKSAKTPLIRSEHLYRDVASHTGIRWELLAACDWMQCKARHGHSPVYGEKLGSLNPDDTCYRTKSAALEQCASDLVQLARSVYQLDITTNRELTIRDLANVFAAFRWGGLLRQHCTSAMDFPYSVAGLTADHTHMRWPNIDEPNAPDKPGSRFRQPFGAVPVVLGLNYQALM